MVDAIGMATPTAVIARSEATRQSPSSVRAQENPVPVIERASVCTFDCPDTCSLNVTVEAGQITKVRGSESAPFTAGVICNKVAQDMAAFVHGPQRLLHPLRRIGPKSSGQFERITWDAALGEIHARVSA